MTALINEPHTYLCKQMGLKTKQFGYMKDGLDMHKIIQEHVSGVKAHPLLSTLPLFPIVETKDFDEKCRVQFTINDKYVFNGFFDGLNKEKGELLEIKTGKTWSPSDFKRLTQWKLYCLGLKDIKKVWLVNTPREQSLWMPQTIKIINTSVTPQDLKEAQEFIDKAIYTIEHIKEVFDTNSKVKGSKFCYYIDCPWCEEER